MPEPQFTSPVIAKKMQKKFGKTTTTVSVDMKYRRDVGNFVRQIEKAHKQAAKSKLKFS